MSEQYKHKAITDLILKAFYKVYNTLGYGFLEKVVLVRDIVKSRKCRFLAATGEQRRKTPAHSAHSISPCG